MRWASSFNRISPPARGAENAEMIGIPRLSGRLSQDQPMAHLINGVFAADMILCSLTAGVPARLEPANLRYAASGRRVFRNARCFAAIFA